jgi:hypothetical protein
MMNLGISGLETITTLAGVITLANADWMELAKTKVFHATVTAIWPLSYLMPVRN